MYYQNYEDYMRQILGYPINDPNIYETYDYKNDQTYEDTYYSRNNVMPGLSDEEIRKLYPDIYNSVYPMVCKVCDVNTQPITRDLIEKMTDEVYNAIQDTSTVVNIRVDTPKPEANRNTVHSSTSSRTDIIRTTHARTPVREENRIDKRERKVVPENREISKVETRQERQNNSILRDLIKILLLERIFGNRPGNPRPPRPPMGPGRPPFPGGRPPIIHPRDYTEYL